MLKLCSLQNPVTGPSIIGILYIYVPTFPKEYSKIWTFVMSDFLHNYNYCDWQMCRTTAIVRDLLIYATPYLKFKDFRALYHVLAHRTHVTLLVRQLNLSLWTNRNSRACEAKWKNWIWIIVIAAINCPPSTATNCAPCSAGEESSALFSPRWCFPPNEVCNIQKQLCISVWNLDHSITQGLQVIGANPMLIYPTCSAGCTCSWLCMPASLCLTFIQATRVPNL